MRVLIVEGNRDLANIWARFLARQGVTCTLAGNAAEAHTALRGGGFEALVLDMELAGGEAIAVADFATYRNPDLPIIAVTARGFFSDGAIFQLVPNARGLLRSPLRLDDMAALIEHYGGRASAVQREAAASGG
ncbi:MAG TPA: response regulator [Amaricoccus sp.]|nr:response regulator [Amaricoccus sp.]